MKMDDTDLFPCPWCRDTNVCVDGDKEEDDFWAICGHCGMMGPCATTADTARSAYNVVARLVDDTINSMLQPAHLTGSALFDTASTFLIERKEHASY